MNHQLIFSERARDYIKKRIATEKGIGLRISIKKTGCSGYSYLPSIVSTVNENDLKIHLADDLMIYLDSFWLHLLSDLEVDYVEETKSGLKQKKLSFKNPKEGERCGCGESFHVDEVKDDV